MTTRECRFELTKVENPHRAFPADGSLLRNAILNRIHTGLEDFDVEAAWGPLPEWNTSSVTNMSEMFRFADEFNQNISDWDTSNVTDMSSMFFQASAFNQDISDWDTSNVTDMSSMFSQAWQFNQDISTWNTSKVISMESMFLDAKAFNQPLQSREGKWSISSVTSMARMFTGARNFNQDISDWDVSHRPDTAGMFEGALAFQQENIAGWSSGGIDTSYMFAEEQEHTSARKFCTMCAFTGYVFRPLCSFTFMGYAWPSILHLKSFVSGV
jgi:surface protein